MKIAPASDKDLLLNQAEITFHELHTAKLTTTFDFFKTLTDMHDMLHHDDHCASTDFGCHSRHRCYDDDDDVWV